MYLNSYSSSYSPSATTRSDLNPQNNPSPRPMTLPKAPLNIILTFFALPDPKDYLGNSEMESTNLKGRYSQTDQRNNSSTRPDSRITLCSQTRWATPPLGSHRGHLSIQTDDHEALKATSQTATPLAEECRCPTRSGYYRLLHISRRCNGGWRLRVYFV